MPSFRAFERADCRSSRISLRRSARSVRCRPLSAARSSRRRLPDDWQRHYGYRPVLIETFVEKPRFTGACYKAANWRYLGDTQGRGKLDRFHRHAEPVKAIWVTPLQHDFRTHLCNGWI